MEHGDFSAKGCPGQFGDVWKFAGDTGQCPIGTSQGVV